MTTKTMNIGSAWRAPLRCWGLAALLAVAACTSDKPKTDAPKPVASDAPAAPADALPDAPSAQTITPQTPTVKAWRKIGAHHIYAKYPKRIFKGKIPPLVYAVVVVETHLDADGKVKDVTFSRVPSHAPEVPGKIAALVRAASPLPSPGKLGAHTYVDTWLWDRSGNFQLDTLTLGQRSK